MSDKIYLNDDWSYSNDRGTEGLKVRLPHTTAVTPFNSFDEKIYQMKSTYSKSFKTLEEWKGKRVILTIDGAAHQSEVILNGKSLKRHDCGYTAFSTDLTESLNPSGEENSLLIKVDSNESLNQPPFGYVIDYMTYGGIYRDVYLEIKNPVYISDVFVHTKLSHAESEVTLNTAEGIEGYTVAQKITSAIDPSLKESGSLVSGVKGQKVMTAMDASPVVQWSLDNPYLYNLVTELKDEAGNTVDVKTVRFGFRDIRYDETGFYLNGTKVKIRGLNRHQSYPYVGYAMPKNVQIEDADILKYELGLNEVRTSHYPQSQYFVDRCDEIGLLVFTEIPGWQHIGQGVWKDQAVENVKDMVTQYRNHPSIFMWGVRINESLDDDELYERTNKAAHDLDKTRPTGGVRYLKHSHLLEDVYTYNDFSHTGDNPGVALKENVTDTHKGYMVTEYNGHMFPTKAFDCESHRIEHAVRHANVLDAVAGYEKLSGSSGWCAFDYNTHKDFGSGDRICYHGVMDMFRNPKMAAYVYQSQQEREVAGDVLCVSSSMDIGEWPAGARGNVWIFTNADSVRMYVNDIFIKEYTRENSPYRNLKHGPILIDDYIGNRLVDEDGIKPKWADDIKFLLHEASRIGEEKAFKKHFMMALRLMMFHVVDYQKVRALYGKYIGNWGGSVITYKFEAIKDGKVVKTVFKRPGSSTLVKAVTSRKELVEEHSYDVSSVRITAVDEYGNVQPYCQEAVTLSTEGDIEIIGPKAVSLKGGMAGTYVKSLGKAGKGALIITDWTGKDTRIDFTVSKD